MKTSIQLNQLSQETLEQLTTQVSETIATNLQDARPAKTFGAVDMWKIRRNRSSITRSRYSA
ncbi:MAG: hypothetical protein JWQ27_846 [Ferruginibacter sp.]|nr:hypothetical protein [Ferruginibacter sp.]